ncbi:MAG: nuclear transport factor 2 family protein [Acidobacteria bacterium]|nr:nuclear transport factor 2 family protein [Acidobacteriota bacterium]MCI0660540.1 nuclear transport factor 2 family protein [Acidobacteriota bacterium]
MRKAIFVVAVLYSVIFSVLSQENDLSPALSSLVDAERAFAKLSVEKGVREAFMTYFAEDGINFQPHPTITIENYRKNAGPPIPPPVTLNWAPIYGDVSQAGDLGYNTGPYVLEDNRAEKKSIVHGLFFSVWKKQADGNWRVIVDMGVPLEHPFATLDSQYQPAPQWKTAESKRTEDVKRMNDSLLRADRSFFTQAKSVNAAPAWQQFLSDDARICRRRTTPVIGKDALNEWIDKQNFVLTGEPIKADVSQSADLGYSYGKYEIKSRTRTEKGYYVRVWKRDAKGQWRIVFDVSNPLL